MNIKNKNITIMGAQRSGLACAKLVKKFGGNPRLSDINDRQNIAPEILSEIEQLTDIYELGGHTQEFIEESDLLVISPGVSIFSKEVMWARGRGISVLGEVEFAFQFCDKPVIAVTGSNGKTTTVTLIDMVLKEAGFNSQLCGNIGYPFSNYVMDCGVVDYFVLEVSSFQLESVVNLAEMTEYECLKDLKPFKPHIAVILNLNQNHLDRHQDMNEYLLAKKRIFINQDQDDYVVLDKNADFLNKVQDDIPSTAVFFNEQEVGSDEMNLNQLAVCRVAEICGISRETCSSVFKKFPGVEHRMEWVREFEGVEYINDSKATTAESCLWALDHIKKPIVMICGGRDKNIDFSVVNDSLKDRVKKVYVFGEAKEKIAQTFEQTVKVEMCDFLQHAITKAKETAEQGDCVLFSPMCVSFDMFSNFEERGQTFKELVNELE